MASCRGGDTHFCSGRLQITIPGVHPVRGCGCSHRRRRRRRRRCRRRRRRWQIINIHYVLTKLSHKLCARGKNGIVDNGWVPDEHENFTVPCSSVRCSKMFFSLHDATSLILERWLLEDKREGKKRGNIVDAPVRVAFRQTFFFVCPRHTYLSSYFIFWVIKSHFSATFKSYCTIKVLLNIS